MPSFEDPGEFLRHAVLDTVVPHASNIDLEAALTSALEGGADDLPAVLSSIPQRSLLFFGRWIYATLAGLYLLLISSDLDEYCTPRIILRLSNCSESSLKHHLQHLEVRLDAFAIEPAESVAESPTPTRDLIFSGVVGGDEDPLVVVNEFESDMGSGNHVYVIWSIETFLSMALASLVCLTVILIAN